MISNRFDYFGAGFFAAYFLASLSVYFLLLFYAEYIASAYQSILFLLAGNFFIYFAARAEYKGRRVYEEIEISEVGDLRR